ncbi:MAG: PLP-dependent aminotransferase family protein [Lachnospiraceae bacterium]|nr:PLP-dependent aminotransferase family protein [Lachnospiraceae bacterium]
MFELTIELQTDNGKCLYEQIYEYIRQEIREGKLLQGERLPSTRSLAEYLQISRSTVEVAYEQLLSEGYIEAQPYRGYFVCKIEDLFRLEGQTTGASPLSVVQGKVSGNTASGVTCRYDFSPTRIDMSCFPFGAWRRINKNILSDDNVKLFSQGNAQGDYGLRETIARYLYASRGVNCTPEQIIVGAGNDYLLMLLEKILGKELPIAMENPTYKRAYQIFESFSYPIITIDMDESGLRVSELKKTDATLTYVMPSHQYPTGVVMPIGRRSELLRWANEREERYLIEDDYDSEFRYKGKPIPSLQSSDKNGKVIYIGTFSKAIAPAIRVSYMVLPMKLVAAYKERCYFYSTTVSRIDQKILDEFIRGGYFERHLNKMRKVYKDKHDMLLDKLECFKEVFNISGENAGLHLLLTAKGNLTEQRLIDLAAEQGVKVYGLSDSLVDSEETRESHTVILGYGGLTQEEIEKGVEALKKAWL